MPMVTHGVRHYHPHNPILSTPPMPVLSTPAGTMNNRRLLVLSFVGVQFLLIAYFIFFGCAPTDLVECNNNGKAVTHNIGPGKANVKVGDSGSTGSGSGSTGPVACTPSKGSDTGTNPSTGNIDVDLDDLRDGPPTALLDLLEEYRKFHVAAQKDPKKHKYIVFVANEYAGLGNRLNGLAGVLYMAVATQRVLMVDWPTTLPEKFAAQYHELFDVPKGMIMSSSDPVWQGYIDQNRKDTMDFSLMTGRPVVAACEKDYGLQHDVEVIHSYSNFINMIIDNPHLKDNPFVLAMDRETIFGDLVKWLCRPGAEVRKLISALTDGFNGRVAVGMQIRLGINPTVDDMGSGAKTQAQQDKFLKCALGVGKYHINRRNRLWARSGVAAAAKKDDEPVFFVASDRLEMAQKIESIVGKDSNRVFFQKEQVNRDTVDGIRAAVADVWALSMCDEIVVSPRSTYGLLAAAMMGHRRAYIVASGGVCFQRIGSLPFINSPFGAQYETSLACRDWSMMTVDLANSLDHSEAEIGD